MDDGRREIGHNPSSLRWAGAAFLVTAALGTIRSVAVCVLGPPPADGPALSAWVSGNRAGLIVVDEALVLGAVALVPAVLGLHGFLTRRTARPLATTSGTVLVLVASTVTVVLAAVHGRLVYPIHDIEVTSVESLRLVVTVADGGAHVVALILALAALLLAVASLVEPGWRPVAWVGFGAAVAHLASAYPDQIGRYGLLVADLVALTWWAVLGIQLLHVAGRGSRTD